MKVGYARTSTTEQIAGLDAQVRDLKQAGCEKLFAEQVSSVGERAQLTAALDFIREGDTLVVAKLDRLARSIGHLSEITKVARSQESGPAGSCDGPRYVHSDWQAHAERHRVSGAV